MPLNLIGLKCFGETMWVHNISSSKLDTCAWEGQWISFDTESYGHHVYWPMKGTVSIEWNIYFRASQQLKGEPLAMPTFLTLNKQLPAPASATYDLSNPPSTPEPPVDMLLASMPRCACMPTPSAPPPIHPTHACIPLHIICNLQSSVGISSTCPSNPAIP